MAFFADVKVRTFWALCLLLFVPGRVLCYLFRVGDLDAWGVPAPVTPKIYDDWSQNNKFRIGDSLLFLYPPSEESLVQVTEDAFKSCNISNPIAYFNDGNTLFNITGPGTFYFTSGVGGHCLRLQKLAVFVPSNGTSNQPSSAPSSLPGSSSSSYPTVFGPTASARSSAPAMSVASVYSSMAYLVFSFLLLIYI
ncbi:mavicyanin-like [Nymphaea colorata]|nr:mavicyanin-like [Nymphaea colorata]